MVISAIVGMMRGAFKEIITILTWIIAGFTAINYGANFGNLFEHSIKWVFLRNLLGGSIIFIGAFYVGKIINVVVNNIIKVSKFVVIDKISGAILGVTKCICMLLIAINLVDNLFINETWWQNSFLLPKLQTLLVNIKILYQNKTSEH